MKKQVSILKAIKEDLKNASNGGLMEGLYWRLSSFIKREFPDSSVYNSYLSRITAIDSYNLIYSNKVKLLSIIDQILDEIDQPVLEAPESKLARKENQKAYCYRCEDETNQAVLFNDTSFGPQEIVGRNEEGDESQSAWTVDSSIWIITKCQGCETLNFTHIIRTSPDRNTDRVFHFPKKLLRSAPSWTMKLPIKYLEILHEIYASLNEQLFILSLTGTRILLDTYMVDKVGDIGTFKQKVAKLVSQGFIAQNKAKVLETTIEAGNAATHRGFKPDKGTLFDILDIIENLLQFEIVDRQGTKIRDMTPQRPRNK
jgi:hypothetical protein